MSCSEPRRHSAYVTGDEATVDAFRYASSKNWCLWPRAGGVINEQQVNPAISMVKSGKADQLHALFADTLNITEGRTITPKNGRPKGICRRYSPHNYHFGIGPAGTGKTFLAVNITLAKPST